MDDAAGPGTGTISVVLADDNLIVREGVRALIERHKDLRIVGVAADYDEVIQEATSLHPQVLVTDIRMPPEFNREGIDAAKEVRKRHPGTGVVILSQYDDPEYAVSLLAEGSAGYGYLLKDHIARAISSSTRSAPWRPAAMHSTRASSTRWFAPSPRTAA